MSTPTRELNWFGWSVETIAAVYETDAAYEDFKRGEVDMEYVWAAWRAEADQNELDSKYRKETQWESTETPSETSPSPSRA